MAQAIVKKPESKTFSDYFSYFAIVALLNPGYSYFHWMFDYKWSVNGIDLLWSFLVIVGVIILGIFASNPVLGAWDQIKKRTRFVFYTFLAITTITVGGGIIMYLIPQIEMTNKYCWFTIFFIDIVIWVSVAEYIPRWEYRKFRTRSVGPVGHIPEDEHHTDEMHQES